ncbi:Uncharacterised protein [Budvicia aquatica]|uniref:Uncharacterized protein n=1 Tax=Budvicia aquatica TaxID=82979 RepID=A0A484ZKI2_9GAMM|nr:Uncharacterised protein [Budvicia aquatica]
MGAVIDHPPAINDVIAGKSLSRGVLKPIFMLNKIKACCVF